MMIRVVLIAAAAVNLFVVEVTAPFGPHPNGWLHIVSAMCVYAAISEAGAMRERSAQASSERP